MSTMMIDEVSAEFLELSLQRPKAQDDLTAQNADLLQQVSELQKQLQDKTQSLALAECKGKALESKVFALEAELASLKPQQDDDSKVTTKRRRQVVKCEKKQEKKEEEAEAVAVLAVAVSKRTLLVTKRNEQKQVFLHKR